MSSFMGKAHVKMKNPYRCPSRMSSLLFGGNVCSFSFFTFVSNLDEKLQSFLAY